MKKILIISYFYPPGNFAGSYRIHAWATYLRNAGYEPIIVTRHWDQNCTDFTAISQENDVLVSKENGIKVFRTPYKGTFRDRLIKKNRRFNIVGKIFSFINLLFSLYWLKLNPAHNLLSKSREILSDDQEIQLVITSGRPFYQFQFLSQLRREFPHIRCFGDYRDPWNTNTNINQSAKRKFFRWLETPIEKKTINSFEGIITCSEGIKDNIKTLIKNKPITVITNGFDDFIKGPEKARNNNLFEIAYIGSLYDNQEIERFIIPLMSNMYHKRFKLIFYGLNNQEKQKNRILDLTEQSTLQIEIKPWLEKEEMLNEAVTSDALLICGIPDRKGTYTAKFFDYLALQKNIILCPSDNDVLQSEINRLNLGWILNDQSEINEWISLINRYMEENKRPVYSGNQEEIEKFKYEAQVNKLANILGGNN